MNDSNRVGGADNRRIKQVVGLLIARPLLAVLSPVTLLIGLAIVLDSGFTVFYRGERGGSGAKPFHILKFRTMIPDAKRVGGRPATAGRSGIRCGGFINRRIPIYFGTVRRFQWSWA